MGGYPFVLYVAGPEEWQEVAGLVRKAARWLADMRVDQWRKPWPNQAGHDQRIMDDLGNGKTRLLRDGASIAATITIDAHEPMAEKDQPVWPVDKDPKAGGVRPPDRRQPALRRVRAGRRHARLGGADSGKRIQS